jgi:hypothetical protein
MPFVLQADKHLGRGFAQLPAALHLENESVPYIAPELLSYIRQIAIGWPFLHANLLNQAVPTNASAAVCWAQREQHLLSSLILRCALVHGTYRPRPKLNASFSYPCCKLCKEKGIVMLFRDNKPWPAHLHAYAISSITVNSNVYYMFVKFYMLKNS